MNWARMLAYITGTVDQELLLRNEYLAAENRILKAQVRGRLLLSEADKATLAEIAHRLGLPKQLDRFSEVSTFYYFPKSGESWGAQVWNPFRTLVQEFAPTKRRSLALTRT